MINVVIPMAGRGKRFLDKGIETPKPLIEINSDLLYLMLLIALIWDVFFYFLIREIANSYDFDTIFRRKNQI